MYKANEYVRYGEKGVFQVQSIQKRALKGKELIDCYILYANQNGLETTVITPITNPFLRKILTKEEAIAVIKKFKDIEIEWNDNRHIRDEWARNILISGDVEDMAKLIKSAYLMKIEKNKVGKDISSKDKDVFRNAEKLLYEELSVSLGIKKEDVIDYIKDIIEGSREYE